MKHKGAAATSKLTELLKGRKLGPIHENRPTDWIGTRNWRAASASRPSLLRQSSSTSNVSVSASVKDEEEGLEIEGAAQSRPRSVWMDINALYAAWREMKGSAVNRALVILPDIDCRWIIDYKLHRKKIDIEPLRNRMFRGMLSWKMSMGSAFCFRNNATFWLELCDALNFGLKDPTKSGAANYGPLILNEGHYRSLHFRSRFGVDKNDICSTLRCESVPGAIARSAIKEVLSATISTLDFVAGACSLSNSSSLLSITNSVTSPKSPLNPFVVAAAPPILTVDDEPTPGAIDKAKAISTDKRCSADVFIEDILRGELGDRAQVRCNGAASMRTSMAEIMDSPSAGTPLGDDAIELILGLIVEPVIKPTLKTQAVMSAAKTTRNRKKKMNPQRQQFRRMRECGTPSEEEGDWMVSDCYFDGSIQFQSADGQALD